MQGVQNIDDIIRVSDGIMVARGDMGVEIPLEDVPVIQKMIIKESQRCRKSGYHGDPDVGFHDETSASDPRGGDRRCQRNL